VSDIVGGAVADRYNEHILVVPNFERWF